MASFEPTINPVNPPDFGAKSRPVDLAEGIRPQGVAENKILPQGVKQGDLSAAYAGEAAAAGEKQQGLEYNLYGDLFKGIVGTADFLGKAGVQMVKKDIEDKVYAVADRERQAYTDALEQIKASGGVRNILDAPVKAEDDEGETPTEIQNLPNTLGGLQAGRDSGKISGTYYLSRLLAEAKNLRAQYPGFREEIDQQFSKVTGVNPANAYVHSLVNDINRASLSANSEVNRTLSFLKSKIDKYPNAMETYLKLQNGLISPQQATLDIAPYAKQDAVVNYNHTQYQGAADDRGEQERLGKLNFDYAAGVVTNRATDLMLQKMGIKSQADVDAITSAQTGGTGPSAKQWEEWGAYAKNLYSNMYTKMIQDADAHGYTKQIGGKEEVIKRVEQALKPFQVGVIDRIYNQDAGGLYGNKRQIAAINDDTAQKMLTDKRLGPTWQVLTAMKNLGGEQNLQKFSQQILQGNYAEDLKDFQKRFTSQFATQFNMQTTGIPTTFNDVLDMLKENNRGNDAKFNKAVMGEVQKIADPTIPEAIRRNYALAAFSPQNQGMISRLQSDGYDAKGKPIAGQNAVFQQWTSPQMTRAMYELGQKDPEIWRQYTNWAKRTITSELLPNEIQGLARLSQEDPNYSTQVSYDAKNHRFETNFTSGSLNTPTYAQNLMRGSMNRINSAMDNYVNIAKAAGVDPDEFILSSIASASNGTQALANTTGIPYQMMRQLGLARLNMMNNGR